MSEKDFNQGFTDESLEENDLTPDLISLIDDDGKEYEFEILDSYECEEGHYIAIAPYMSEEEEDLDEGDLMILKAVDDEEDEGEFYYSPIEDDAEFNRISEIFVRRLEEFYDIVEDPENE